MKNTLVQYQGGGYSGCIWEWNFAFFDATGKFIDIFSSGSMGCKTEQELLAHMADKRNEGDVFTYDVTNEEQVEEFTTETNEGLVIAVSRQLLEYDVEIMAKCDCCGQKHVAGNMIPEKPTGGGGITIKYTSMICEDCHSSYSCPYCGEYYGKEHNFDEDGYCEYCHSRLNPEEAELSDEEKEELKETKAREKADMAKNLSFKF